MKTLFFFFISTLRRSQFASPAIAFLLIMSLSQAAVTDGFEPRFNSNVYATAVQTDGRILFGGAFTTVQATGTVNETAHSYIARVNADGSVDEGFAVHFDGDVTAIVVETNGKIVIGGKFTTVLAVGASSRTDRRGLARLNPDGSLDTTFEVAVTGQPIVASAVYALTLQADGKILVGGAFTTLQTSPLSTAVVRKRIARLNPDGTLDTSFDPAANNFVYSILVQRDGRIVMGGGFTTLQPNGAAETSERKRIARLNVDGTLDPDFRPRADNRVLALLQQANGMIVAAGDFRTLQTDADEIAIARNFIARIRTDGSIDGDYDPGANASIASLVEQRDGRIIAGGTFTAFRPTSGSIINAHRYLARILPDGSIDEGYDPNPNAAVSSLALQSDGKLVVGGYFTALQSTTELTAMPRLRVARIGADGIVDAGFAPGAGGAITKTLWQPDGKWIIAGAFSSFAGATRNNLARVAADGTLDLGFAPNVNARIDTVALQADGKILIGGAFTTVDSVERTYLARLNADGSLDTAFHPQPNGAVYTLLAQTDGKILVGGAFTTFDPDDNDETTVESRSHLARLNSDGLLDTTFQPATDNVVFALVPQSDGKLIVAGSYTTLQGTGQTAAVRSNLGRLKADGTLDDAFNPTPNGAVYSVSVQGDGAIVLAGAFSSLNPGAVATVAPVERGRLARVKSDGMLDTTYDPAPNGLVTATLIPSSGSLYVGGGFLTVGPTVRQRFARIDGNGVLDAGYELNVNDQVLSLSANPAGRILVGGSFSSVQVGGGGEIIATPDHVVALTPEGQPDSTFKIRAGSDFAGEVQAVAFQADGQVVAGGTFSNLAGGTNQNLARFNATGRLDTTFRPLVNGRVESILVRTSAYEANTGKLFAWLNRDGTFKSDFQLNDISQLSGQINAIAFQPDGMLLVAGAFTDKSAGAGYHIARYFPNGRIDVGFNPAPDGTIAALAVQADGKILVGGGFLNIGGVSRHYIARLNPDGSADSGFNPKASAQVNAFVVQPDGKIVIGGSFTTLDPNSTDDLDVDVTTRSYIARLNTDGTVDADFNPVANGVVLTIVQTSSGQFYVGGAFSGVGTETRYGMARLSSTGAVEAGFDPNIGGTVNAISVQADGRLIVGGAFATVNPNSTDTTLAVTRNNLARLNSDGTLDTTFDPNANGTINALVISPLGELYAAGAFTTFTPNGATDAIVRNRIARLTSTGEVDTSFNPNANAVVNTLVGAADGSLLVGGAFTGLRPESLILVGGEFADISGVNVPRLARLNFDGSPDSSFQPNPDGTVHALATQPDGKVVVAGAFTRIAETSRSRLARFDAKGVLDTTYAPSPDGEVFALAAQGDGRVLIGGLFSSVGSVARPRLARLLSDGSLDTSFRPEFSGTVAALAVQRDGRILVGGSFTRIAGADRTHLARLNSDGSIDATFNPTLNGEVSAIVLQTDGAVVLGGSFSVINGVQRAGYARLAADGSVDSTMSAAANGAVRALALSTDGRSVLGGRFTTINDQPNLLLARVGAASPAIERTVVSSERTAIYWYRLGSGPELSSAEFSYSTDGLNWTRLGQANRSTTERAWLLSSLAALPEASVYYIRTRGTSTSNRQGSGGIVEAIWQFYGTQSAGGPVSLSTLGDDRWVDETTVVGTTPGAGTVTGSSSSGGSSGDDAASPTGSETATSGAARLVNLSTRVALQGSDVVITGFNVTGDTTQHVLLRAVGPGLTTFGVDGAMQKPELRLYDHVGNRLATTNGWVPALTSVIAQAGAFPLSAGSNDAAYEATLAPGGYTVHAVSSQGSGGVVLIEVYSAASDHHETLNALSALGPVSSLSGGLIAGLVIEGGQTQRLLIRGIGPGLGAYGVANALSDPQLRVYDQAGRLLGDNRNWSVAGDATQLRAAALATGAFALADTSADTALIVTLSPGAYTIQVTSQSGSTGQSLIEAYSLK